MNITPYTPIRELRRAVRNTYAAQAFSVVASAVAARMMMFVIGTMLDTINEQSVFMGRLFFAVSGGTSVFLLSRALWISMLMFLDAGSARAGIRWLIAKKQIGDQR